MECVCSSKILRYQRNSLHWLLIKMLAYTHSFHRITPWIFVSVTLQLENAGEQDAPPLICHIAFLGCSNVFIIIRTPYTWQIRETPLLYYRYSTTGGYRYCKYCTILILKSQNVLVANVSFIRLVTHVRLPIWGVQHFWKSLFECSCCCILVCRHHTSL